MSALLAAKGITKIFSSGLVRKTQVVALQNFSLTVTPEQPTITGVVGESGSGKSTMARLLLGLETPTTGEVRYRDKPLPQLTPAELHAFRRDVQVVFQDPFGVYNAFYKVDHVLEVPIQKFNLATTSVQRRQLIEETLQTVGLRPGETLGRYPHQLSGGQRQRLMVARALLVKPKVIIADEPVSMIDASLRATVLDTFRRLHQDFGISIIYITHDLTTAYQISDNLIVLYSGMVAEVGDVEQVVKQPQHPYTQLLVSSIPSPNPEHQWEEEPPASAIGQHATAGQGCRFANRCPHAFAPCVAQLPPLFQSDPHRAAACYLYQEHPVVAPEAMDRLFVRNQEHVKGENAYVAE
ncbi:MAG: ABC transporter ATP-binding protein [Caldilinea sp. CFX5]|nr:ABC transporter ATP-binding protein [Caldilinea sp. CFX5]